MIESVNVIGARGRVGGAVSARLAERGVELPESPGGADVVLLCVPDRAIAEVAAAIEPGPWVAHVSGGTPLTALEPHTRRFSLHPLQTFTHDRGPEQLDGAWAAVTGETDDGGRGRARARRAARAPPVPPRGRPARALPRRRRDRLELPRHPASHRRRAARRRGRARRGARPADAPRDRQRVPADGADRAGDWETVERHRAAIAETAPHLLPAYDELARLTASNRLLQGARRDRRTHRGGGSCRAVRPPRRHGRARADDGRAPRGAPRASRGRARTVRHRRDEPLRQPGAVRRARRPERLPARRGARPRARARGRGRRRLRPVRGEMYPPATRPGST